MWTKTPRLIRRSDDPPTLDRKLKAAESSATEIIDLRLAAGDDRDLIEAVSRRVLLLKTSREVTPKPIFSAL